MKNPPRHCSSIPRPVGLLLVAVLLGACEPKLPTDPDERLAEARQRMLDAPSGVQSAAWMALVRNDHRPATRAFLLECVDSKQHMAAETALGILTMSPWIEDAEVRRQLAAYFVDPLNSPRRRDIILKAALTDANRARYPEFAALPREIVLPPWVARVDAGARR